MTQTSLSARGCINIYMICQSRCFLSESWSGLIFVSEEPRVFSLMFRVSYFAGMWSIQKASTKKIEIPKSLSATWSASQGQRRSSEPGARPTSHGGEMYSSGKG